MTDEKLMPEEEPKMEKAAASVVPELDQDAAAPIKPPRPAKGVEYQWLENDRLCQGCGKLVLAGQCLIRRNARGVTFREYLPLKNGICLKCAADSLSVISVKEYEHVLEKLKEYENLKNKTEITDYEEEEMEALATRINNLNTYVEELSNFVQHACSTGTAYYDDQFEDEDEAVVEVDDEDIRSFIDTDDIDGGGFDDADPGY